MTKQFVEKALLGSGRVFFHGRRVGNVTSAVISYNVETKSVPNKQGGGGNLKTKERISDVSLAFTMTNYIPENMAIAMQASIGDIPETAVSGEAHAANKNELVATDMMIDTSKAVTVTDASDNALPSAHWEASAAGVYIKHTSTITDGDNIKISYTALPQAVLQAAEQFGLDYPVVIEGLNDDNGEPHLLKGHKWKPGPTASFDFLADEYTPMEVSGELLADLTKPLGKSRFFELSMVNT